MKKAVVLAIVLSLVAGYFIFDLGRYLSLAGLQAAHGTLAEWRDGVGSSKGPTYCAQTLNRRALAKAAPLLGK